MVAAFTASLLGPLDYMFGQTLRLAVTTAVLLALAVAVAARFNGWSFERAAKNWLWITSLVTIFLFTQHSPYKGQGHVLELSPLADLKAAKINDHRRDLVLANLALFAPFGIAAAWRAMGFVKTLKWALGISVLAETLQYVLGQGRVSQLVDVIVNTAGALAGWVAAAAMLFLASKPSRTRSEAARETVQV